MKKLWLRMFAGWVAEVRREARKRTLDEIDAMAQGNEMAGGVGSDVWAVYWTIMTHIRRREAMAQDWTVIGRAGKS
jgi:hypothetical protein